jgi:hypothetical protein
MDELTLNSQRENIYNVFESNSRRRTFANPLEVVERELGGEPGEPRPFALAGHNVDGEAGIAAAIVRL